MNVSMLLMSVLLLMPIAEFAGEKQGKPAMPRTISSKALSIQTKGKLPGRPAILEDFDWENVSDEEEPLLSPTKQSPQEVELLTRSECDRKGDHEHKIELDQKIVASVPSIQKNARDTQYFWGLYDTGTRCIYGENYGFSHDAARQEYLDALLQISVSVAVENTSVLSTTRKIRNNNMIKELTPLVAYAQSFSSFYPDEDYRMHWYKKAFGELLKIDKDNSRRVQALQCFVRALQNKLVEGLLYEEIDISHAPDLVVGLVDAHTEVNDKPSFFSRFVQTGEWSYTKLPQNETQPVKKFIAPSPFEQAKALLIAQMLVKKGAPLTGLNDGFPCPLHAKKCLSCLYLRNCMLDKREAQKS